MINFNFLCHNYDFYTVNKQFFRTNKTVLWKNYNFIYFFEIFSLLNFFFDNYNIFALFDICPYSF